MPVDRFLGAAWASVHGPSGGRELLRWTLGLGYRGLVPAPSPRPVDWSGLAAEIPELPAELPALRVAGVQGTAERPGRDLAAARDGDRRTAEAEVGDAVAQARALGCSRVILEPGIPAVTGERGPVDLGDLSEGWTPERAQAQLARRKPHLDRALDAACRSLHRLCKRFEDILFCLTSSRHIWSLGDPAALEAIFEDLTRCRLGYWHDTAVAARRHQLLGEDQGLALEALSKQLSGISLGDSVEGGLYLPPGAGGVDYPLVGSYVMRSGHPLPAVVELDPGVDPREVPGSHAFLDKFGL
jgi:sugar phosphate isomerase/epimerase